MSVSEKAHRMSQKSRMILPAVTVMTDDNMIDHSATNPEDS